MSDVAMFCPNAPYNERGTFCGRIVIVDWDREERTLPIPTVKCPHCAEWHKVYPVDRGTHVKAKP